MNGTVNVAVVGIGGYGENYVSMLLTHADDPSYRIVGFVDPAPQRSRRLEEIQQKGIRLYDDLSQLYRDARPDLVMMATPIHLHAPHTCMALVNGSNVLCEKPVGATPDDARRMLAAERRTGRFAAIGYQWSFSPSIQRLKQDILEGHFGRPIRLKTLSCMPRSAHYFNRNDWAGRKWTNDGTPVFDSPANNASSHFLHNMLYILGEDPHLSATPARVQAELYRANDIENFDTCAIRCITTSGAELLFYASHSVPIRFGTVLRYEFEHGCVFYESANPAGLVARMSDGSIRLYGDPSADRHQKIWRAIEAVRDHKPVACSVMGATPHTLCVAAAQMSMPEIQTFPRRLLTAEQLPDGVVRCVAGLDAALVQCYDQGVLPHEHGGFEWAVPGETIHLDGPDWSLDTDTRSASGNGRDLCQQVARLASAQSHSTTTAC